MWNIYELYYYWETKHQRNWHSSILYATNTCIAIENSCTCIVWITQSNNDTANGILDPYHSKIYFCERFTIIYNISNVCVTRRWNKCGTYKLKYSSQYMVVGTHYNFQTIWLTNNNTVILFYCRIMSLYIDLVVQ